MKQITQFRGEYRFLSNFYPVEIERGGIVYPTLEHCYVSEKTEDLNEREYISSLPTPGKAKKYGSTIILRPKWNVMKVNVMRELLNIKFSHEELLEKLIATEGRDLIEVNAHGDRFWGQCPVGVGKNMLGILLMQIREKELLFR